MSADSYDILVVGGGHAGCEAALAAARLGARTALVTLRADTIAQMSCNPAIGGLAKGQIVREIDALGGQMARVTDATAIQYRLLNRSKGPAVRSPRAQCDRLAYARAMQDVLGVRAPSDGAPAVRAPSVSSGSFAMFDSDPDLTVGARITGARTTGARTPGARTTGARTAEARPVGDLTIIEDIACDVLVTGDRAAGLRCESGRTLAARAVILTTGTFLRGRLHCGTKMWSGGRIDEPAAENLSACLERLGLRLGRLKTGTPPRIDGRTLDYSRLTEQPGDPEPVRFSFSAPEPAAIAPEPAAIAPEPAAGAAGGVPTSPAAPAAGSIKGAAGSSKGAAGSIKGAAGSIKGAAGSCKGAAGSIKGAAGSCKGAAGSCYGEASCACKWVSCWITETTPEVHALIRANLDRAPMYSGQIRSVGPRYCPSLETKIVRFADRPRHQVFLEPEGRATHVVYCNGLSTSLPEDVQDAVIRGIPGLEHAAIIRYGYAIEYDFVPPTQIQATLETKSVGGLYLAGQINGTSGYEEAAGQGLLAGINAARMLQGRPPVVLRRDQAYIGVLIDDLVTKGAEEPYRMFTSLAEHRLILRHDNADRRLMPIGREVGLVSDGAWRRLQEKERQIAAAQTLLRSTRRDGRTLEDLLRRPGVTWQALAAEVPALADVKISPEAWEQAEIEAKYAGYLARQAAQIERARRMEERPIPPGLDYAAVPHLRNEAREKLARIRPRSLGQAGRISGIGPADLAVLMIHLGC